MDLAVRRVKYRGVVGLGSALLEQALTERRCRGSDEVVCDDAAGEPNAALLGIPIARAEGRAQVWD